MIKPSAFVFCYLFVASLTDASKMSFLQRCQRFTATSIITASTLYHPHSVDAFGPVEMTLSDITYKTVELCNGKKPIMPGQKAMEGLFPACIEVSAVVKNPSDKNLKDVSVYGFVKENDAGNSGRLNIIANLSLFWLL